MRSIRTRRSSRLRPSYYPGGPLSSFIVLSFLLMNGLLRQMPQLLPATFDVGQKAAAAIAAIAYINNTAAAAPPPPPVASSSEIAFVKNTTNGETKTTTLSTEKVNPTADEWRKYRLGDWVLKGCKGCSNLQKSMQEPWARNTLGWEYSNGTKLRLKYDKKLFCDIVQKRGGRRDDKKLSSSSSSLSSWLPKPSDIVIHLRLGDILDEMMLLEEAEDAFKYGISIVPSQIRRMNNRRYNTNGWWLYVKSKCFYENVLRKIEEELQQEKEPEASTPQSDSPRNNNKKKRVVIVGSAKHLKNLDLEPVVSLRYAELVREFFEGRGYEVMTRLDGTPDDDMVWMSHSPVFVAAGGGFSTLVYDCVKHLGGVSFMGTGSSPLEEPCWSTPRPDIEMKNYSWEKDDWSGRGPWSGNKNYPPEETIW